MLALLLVVAGAFTEMESMCAADAGALWGRTLCGPMLLVDPQTRAVTANREGVPATLPKNVGIANTAVDWNGTRWTMVMLPLPSDAYARRTLLAHESFHRIQKELGFPATGPANAHLDTMEGRLLLQLEWRSLAAALENGNPDAIGHALLFRERRHALTPSAAEEERALEMHEGLAEYTGTRLAEPDAGKRVARVVAALKKPNDSFSRSFAYASGPAWGLLLERKSPGWTRKLKTGDDLAALVSTLYAVGPPLYRSLTGEERVFSRYDPDGALAAAERRRDERRKARLAELTARFIDGPLLILPLSQMSMEFDPNAVETFAPHGTVYRQLTLRDAWGTIVAGNGALISPDFTRLIVPAGTKVELKEGWEVVAGGREGDFAVRRKPQSP